MQCIAEKELIMQRDSILLAAMALFSLSCNTNGQESTVPPTTPETILHDPPPACAVTQPQRPQFIPPAPYSPTSPFQDSFWYGADSLRTALPQGGVWAGLPYTASGYGQKVGGMDIRRKTSLSLP
jgi:hypothetical protein